VYFDDLSSQLLAPPPIITSSAGVSYSANCQPPNLPGGETVDPDFVNTYCAQSNSPQSHNGVQPGEWVQIAYTLVSPATFDSVIAALDAGTYRVGVHVTAFADGGSVSGINNPPTGVPEPTTLLLVSGGLGLLSLTRRRRSRHG
jgi:hypothetical protein